MLGAVIAPALVRGLVLLLLLLPGCTWFRPPAEPGPPPGQEPLEGFGAATKGGAGGSVIVVDEPTTERVRRAFAEAASRGNVVIRFEVDEPIVLTRVLPRLTAPGVTIEGRGATLDGSRLALDAALVDIRTHDVIVRDLRLRNGYDNLRVQGPEAFNVAIAHVSSTGARDDGISIGYGAHDVTVQYAFLAGNTRAIFCKYEGTANISLHHTWMQKSWARSPLVSGTGIADVRNVIVEDWSMWGARFEDGASGNVVASLFTLSPYAVSLGGKRDSALRLVRAGPVFVAGNAFAGEAVPGPAAAGEAAEPLPAPPVRTLPVDEMAPWVRARAGALPRDAVDEAYIRMREGWRVSKTEPVRLGETAPPVE
jgi:hypothetical protein